MLLKFLISPLSIITTILLLAAIVGTMIFISKYLKRETKNNLYNSLEQFYKKTEEVEEDIVEKAEGYHTAYKNELIRREEKRKNKRNRRKKYK